MLKMICALMLLLMLNFSWNNKLMYFTSMLFPSIIAMYTFQSTTNSSPFWGFEHSSMMLMTLTLWIMPLVIMSSQNISYTSTANYFLNNITILTIILLLAFAVSNLFAFYILFEASLVPTLIIIMKWGYQPERLQASMYLMLYTITASLPLLTGIAWLSYNTPHNMFMKVSHFSLYSLTFWMMMNFAFMVKLPVFFFHLWLPKAHVEAPVAGSMILAAILLKLGGYGMLRMMLMVPPLSSTPKFFLLATALWGGMITSLICVRQQDLKSLIAYSSVGHMSLAMAGILSNTSWGMWGTMTMMLSHGLLSSAMFASVNMSYTVTNSRSILLNKGLNLTLPTMSMLWFIMCAMNMAAPPSSNLLAEIMLISSTLTSTKLMIIPISVMSFTAAAYSLTLYINMNHGPQNPLTNPSMTLKPQNLTIILAHLIPIITLMFMPALIALY